MDTDRMHHEPGSDDSKFAPERFAIATFGLRIGVMIEPPELRDEAMLRLPPGWEGANWRDLHREVRLERDPDTDATNPRYRLCIDDEGPMPGLTAELAIDRFEHAIQYHVAEFAHPWLFVHAGVVMWNGKAILLPGRSNAGKSTLVHALVEAGASYFSDEYAVLDAEGDVWPYPRRLALRAGPFGEPRRVRHLTALREPQAARIGLIALLTFANDTGWDVDAITPAQAVLGLCDNTVAIQRRPKDTLEYLARAVEGAVAIRGARGEARDAARRILHGCLG